MQGIFAFYVAQYQPVTYGNDYQYPKWVEAIGICISLTSMLWIPVYAVYYIITTPGTLKEVKGDRFLVNQIILCAFEHGSVGG